MRSSDHYTVSGDSILLPGPEEYLELYQSQQWLVRLAIRIEAFFRGEPPVEVLRRREHRALAKRLTENHDRMIDPSIPALKEGFVDILRKMSNRLTAVQPVVQSCTSSRAGAYLYHVLQQVDPDTEREISVARTLPPALLNDSLLSVKAANSALRDAVRNVLERTRSTVTTALDPSWQCMIALRRLGDIPYRVMIPERSATIVAIPVRSVTRELVQLKRELDFCGSHRLPAALEMAAQFAVGLVPRSGQVPTDFWSAIDDMRRTVPLEDIVRLSLEEPRIKVLPAVAEQDWWPYFERFVVGDLDATDTLFKRRLSVLEDILRSRFGVVADPSYWLPATLYQRSVDAVQRISRSQEFRRTRVLAGTLAREEDVLTGAKRKKLLDAHVLMDRHLDKLDSLVGTVEKPGTLGESVRRLRNGVQDKQKLMVAMNELFGQHRPNLKALLQESADSLTVLHQVFREEKGLILRRLPNLATVLGDVFGDLSLRHVVDVILEQYPPLADALMGMISIEHELSQSQDAGTEELETVIADGSGGEKGE